MIVSLKQGADPARVAGELAARGLWVSRVEGGKGPLLVVAPHSAPVDAAELERVEGVADVAVPKPAWPLLLAQGPVVKVGGPKPRAVGGREPALVCGPCGVESEAQISEIALALAEAGVGFLRGGAFKPRTSPYAFQGHGEKALGWMRRAADAAGMAVVTEAMSELDVPAVAEHADLVQVGSRNMQNFALLKAVGRAGKPALLKRGMASTLEEWMLAAEYLLSSGAPGVVFCERGIRGFDPSTRNLLDLGAVAVLAGASRLPVLVDPSHAVGRRDLLAPLARASLAAGAAGVMIEVHENPARAKSDGPQALPLPEAGALVRELTALAAALGAGRGEARSEAAPREGAGR